MVPKATALYIRGAPPFLLLHSSQLRMRNNLDSFGKTSIYTTHLPYFNTINMKAFIPTALAFAASIAVILGLPADPKPAPTWHQIGENDLGPIYSTTLPEKRSDASWYKVGETENGPVYSSIEATATLPQKRNDAPWYKVGESDNGPVYSSIKPTVLPRGDEQSSSRTITEYNAWLAKE
jgi:hypothetical protein